MKAVVGLGTNLGDRIQNLRDALASIDRVVQTRADYFDMSMSEFFDEGNVLSPTVQKAINAIRKLNEQDAALVLSMIQRLSLPLQKDGAECQGEAK